MARVTATQEGVDALKRFASELCEGAEMIKAATDALQSAFDENQVGLGPHDASIQGILDEIREIEKAASEPVETLAEKLEDVADAYQDIVDNDRYHGGSGN